MPWRTAHPALTPLPRSAVASACSVLAQDTLRGADAARRAVTDNVRRLEGARGAARRSERTLCSRKGSLAAVLRAHSGAYFSGRTLSGADEVFPVAAPQLLDGHSVRASAQPPLRAFVATETLPPDLAPYLHAGEAQQ